LTRATPPERLQFRLLGSFEVSDGHRPLALGGFKQQAVLVILVLSANEVVSADRLVDELWRKDPPRQATGSLQAYVSNLRRALDPGRAPREASGVLRTQGAGYLLAADPADIDAARFEQLAADGRVQLREGHPQAARVALADALTLWRGPALAEFRDESFAAGDAARLEELRIDALEARLAADLALGEHGAVVAELQRLVVDEPLREQLWAHLITALYRSGRQADALAAYERCRRTLVDRLGIEPNPALRQLQADVLAQAPSLDPAPATKAALGGGGAPARPQLPAPASLAYRDATQGLQVFPLQAAGDRISVGRGASADIRLSWDVRVSRLHAELQCGPDGWAVIDDGDSSNGSYLNGVRVRGRHALADGDELRFGETAMTFRLHAQSAAAETYLGTVPLREPD